MIYILSWTIKKHQKTLSRLIHSKLKKIQGLFKDWVPEVFSRVRRGASSATGRRHERRSDLTETGNRA